MRSFLTTLAMAGTILVLAACAPATNPKSPSKTPVTNTPITQTPITETPAPAYVNTGTPAWAKTVTSSTAHTEFLATATDGSGNVYAVGYVRGVGTHNFGNSVTVTGVYTGSNAVLVKYSSAGTALWAQTVSVGSSYSTFTAVTTDSSGNIYAVGFINGTGTFNFGSDDGVAGTSAGNNAVLVKYNASATVLGTQTLSQGSGNSLFNAVTTDSSGNVYAVGSLEDPVTYGFGNGVIVTPVTSSKAPFVVKYNAETIALWARTTVSESPNSEFSAVATDGSGNVYAAGYTSQTEPVDFGNSATVTGPWGGNNLVLVKYSALGTPQWAKTVSSGPSDSQFVALAADSSSNVYAAGYIRGTDPYGFGNSVTVTGTNSGINVALVKYNTSGIAQWAQTVSSGSLDSSFMALAADSSDNVYAAGYIYGTDPYDFGNGVTATGGYSGGNVALVKYNASGTAQWAKTASRPSSSSQFLINGVAAESSGSVYTAGYITGTGTYDFGNGVTVAGVFTGDNAVLVKYE